MSSIDRLISSLDKPAKKQGESEEEAKAESEASAASPEAASDQTAEVVDRFASQAIDDDIDRIINDWDADPSMDSDGPLTNEVPTNELLATEALGSETLGSEEPEAREDNFTQPSSVSPEDKALFDRLIEAASRAERGDSPLFDTDPEHGLEAQAGGAAELGLADASSTLSTDVVRRTVPVIDWAEEPQMLALIPPQPDDDYSDHIDSADAVTDAVDASQDEEIQAEAESVTESEVGDSSEPTAIDPFMDWDPSQVSELTVPGEQIELLGDTEPQADPAATSISSTSRSSHVELDLGRLSEIGIVTPDGGKSKMADEYRMIKRPLLDNILGQGEFEIDHPNLIMTTSSMPGEGKTFSSINLAMSMAMELDRTVLLIDADVAKPSFNRVFDIDAGAGLIEVLLGEAAVEDVILTTNVPELRIMPAGRRHAHSVELLASDNMRRLTRELSERYEDRVLIFDAPPLLATAEAVVLANLMSQIVVIVEANKTPQYMLNESLNLIDRSKYVSLILNKARTGSRGAYYYDYRDSYYYGYGG